MRLHFNPVNNTVDEVKTATRLLRELIIRNNILKEWVSSGTMTWEDAERDFRNTFEMFTKGIEV